MKWSSDGQIAQGSVVLSDSEREAHSDGENTFRKRRSRKKRRGQQHVLFDSSKDGRQLLKEVLAKRLSFALPASTPRGQQKPHNSRQEYASPELTETRYYRSLDEIENLVLRVSLFRVHDSLHPRDANPVQDERALGDSCCDVTVSWQQKIFSPRELLYLHRMDPSTASASERQQRAQISKAARTQGTVEHKVLTAGHEGALGGPVIFTRVNHEVSTEISRQQRTFAAKERSSLSTNSSFPEWRNSSKRAVKADCVLDERQSGVRDIHYKEMEVLAFVKDTSYHNAETNREDDVYVEKSICRIRAHTNGLLTMTPGLTNPEKRPTFSVLSGDLYCVLIENASLALQDREEDKEFELFTEVYKKRSEYLASTVGENFLLPPPLHSLRLHMIAEIVSAHDFTREGTYVQFSVKFPSSCEMSLLPGKVEEVGPEISKGGWKVRTQLAEPVWDPKRDSWVAGFGHSVETVAEIALDVDDNVSTLAPTLYVQVCSLDPWNRHRLEGYGHLRVPLRPGLSDMDIATWRPTLGPMERMQEYFTGGTRELEDMWSIGLSEGDKSALRYGFRTESAGMVRVRLGIVHQSTFVVGNSVHLTLFFTNVLSSPLVLFSVRKTIGGATRRLFPMHCSVLERDWRSSRMEHKPHKQLWPLFITCVVVIKLKPQRKWTAMPF
ncbi:hypothetical protein M427DRAFT_208546 [Gonapodya prolifera JEL478]|uniref:Meckel syndrome type 1 protein n=1 Tax=Gonapodya prolifera (strain JEL478) TaxID=1344416 RepID=A0A139APA4_GONPJ|nr:hypothetical protein M427DRAFT_208546 [Gonapodya prolifera JEL478]|eukprot:KXS18343.1 hypothetical protein M427DRAFT_208546 [Gonapodya prolifera JEL478]